MASKTVRMIKPWGLHPVGEEFTTDESVADLLIQNGRAEEVKPEPAKGKKGKEVKPNAAAN